MRKILLLAVFTLSMGFSMLPLSSSIQIHAAASTLDTTVTVKDATHLKIEEQFQNANPTPVTFVRSIPASYLSGTRKVNVVSTFISAINQNGTKVIMKSTTDVIHDARKYEATIPTNTLVTFYYEIAFLDSAATEVHWPLYIPQNNLPTSILVREHASLPESMSVAGATLSLERGDNDALVVHFKRPTASVQTPSLAAIVTTQLPSTTTRRFNNDWYFKDFAATYTLRPDATLVVEEKITADASDLKGKHGIFRVVPTQYRANTEEILQTPVTLRSITDFSGRPHPYTTINSSDYHTVTWQIGDANVEVQGVNEYKIIYEVANVVQQNNAATDIWKWNIAGAFWDLKIDHFSADIHFPAGINSSNTSIETKFIKEQGVVPTSYASFLTSEWTTPGVFRVESKRQLGEKEGIQVVSQLPKQVLQPRALTISERYGNYFFWLIPLLTLLLCFIVWQFRGRDAVVNKAQVVEYSPPENLSPGEIGLLLHQGRWKNNFLSANVLRLAAKQFIEIQTIRPKTFFRKAKIAIVSLMDEKKSAQISMGELNLLHDIMAFASSSSASGQSQVTSDDLTLGMRQKLPVIKERIINGLISKKLLGKSSGSLPDTFVIVGGLLILAALPTISWQAFWSLGMPLIISGIIVMIFSLFMGQLTPEGAEMRYRIEGFREFMTQAEKYRQVFFEKEGLFMELLPYAMIFGITHQWVQTFKVIYENIDTNRYVVSSFGDFSDVASVLSNIESISSSISSSMSSGSSGGSGGGGGGGGW